MSTTKGREAAKAAAWITAGALGATALTGIAFAATDSPTTSPTPSATQAPDAEAAPPAGGMGMRGGPGGMHGKGPGALGRGLGDVLHGDVTVEREDGTAELVRVQRGTVESVGEGTVTVKSSDGYTSTWTVNDQTTLRRDRDDATVTDLKAGDTVLARGPVDGDQATARVLQALSPEAAAQMQERIEEFKERRAERRGESEEEPTQGSNSSSSASFDISVI
jgi:hypothetical protein